MNSRLFALLVLNLAALWASSDAIFLGDDTVVNGANIILATGQAGVLSTPLAVLGVLNLLAAGAIALGYISLGGDDGDDYGRSSGLFKRKRVVKRKRTQRDAPEVAPHEQEQVFAIVAAMDTYGCGKQLVCELEAKPVDQLEQDEQVLLRLFGGKGKKTVNAASPKAEYDLAAELGLASKSQVICRERYAACPYTAPEMMAALRNSQW